MKQTQFCRSVSILAALALLAGIGMMGHAVPLYASLTGAGPLLAATIRPIAEEAPVIMQEPQHYAIAEAGIQLILGMLFVLLGLFLHTFARATGERAVHITVKPSRTMKSAWYWMHVRIS